MLQTCKISLEELDQFLAYAANFLSNIGNYFVCLCTLESRCTWVLTVCQGSGDQKFVPKIDARTVAKLATVSNRAMELYNEIREPLFSIPPFSLGFPSDLSQSAYYLGTSKMAEEEITYVSMVMEQHSILPENTRIRKVEIETGSTVFEILQASVESDGRCQELPVEESSFPAKSKPTVIRLVKGDHSTELSQICSSLSSALKYAASPRQETFISQYIQSFSTGDLEAYRDSQRTWVTDLTPRIENIFGFVEPYRDPSGVRAEFEGLVAISNEEETKALTRLVEESDRFIRKLPWAKGAVENNKKGPFEKALFEPPDFTSIHGEMSQATSEPL